MKKHHVAVFALAGLLTPSSLLAQTNPASPPAATYTQGQCKMTGIAVWKAFDARIKQAMTTLSNFRPTGPNGAPTPAEQQMLASEEVKKTDSMRFKTIGQTFVDAFGSYAPGTAPLPTFSRFGDFTPVLSACLTQYGPDIEAAQKPRWIDYITTADGNRYAIDASNIKTVGPEVHMRMLVTPTASFTVPTIGLARSSVTHFAITCAAPRTYRTGIMYYLQPSSDNVLAMEDMAMLGSKPIANSNQAIASLASVACGETRLRAEAQSFATLRAIVANQEAARPITSSPSPTLKR